MPPNGKLAFTVEELLEIHPGGRTILYREIKEGRLIARKLGRSTIILLEDYQAYLRALPAVGVEK